MAKYGKQCARHMEYGAHIRNDEGQWFVAQDKPNTVKARKILSDGTLGNTLHSIKKKT